MEGESLFSPWVSRPVWLILRYILPFAIVAMAIFARAIVRKVGITDMPSLMLLAGVMVTATFGGLGPGLLTTLLATISQMFFFQDNPDSRWDWGDLTRTLPPILLAMEGVIISVLCAALIRARQRVLNKAAEARHLERELLRSSDRERWRIGQDLHDGLGQHLTGVAFFSAAMAQRLESIAPPEAVNARRMGDMVNNMIAWTRYLSRSLAPVSVEANGLLDALESLTAQTQELYKIQCTFDDDVIDLPSEPTILVDLYRIAQEAISNAIRHGHASLIQVELKQTGSQLMLSVTDDGCGMPSGGTQGPGLGLRIMRHRAVNLRGSLVVEHNRPQGTIICCVIPLQVPATAGAK